MKKLIIMVMVLLLMGCNSKTKIEVEKDNYLESKKELESVEEFSDSDSLPCDIVIETKRKDDDRIKYMIKFSNPKEDMSNIEILAINSEISSEVYPSVGIMDEKIDNMDEDIVLSGYIESEDNVTDLDVVFKIMIKYISNGEDKVVYYKSTI